MPIWTLRVRFRRVAMRWNDEFVVLGSMTGFFSAAVSPMTRHNSPPK